MIFWWNHDTFLKSDENNFIQRTERKSHTAVYRESFCPICLFFFLFVLFCFIFSWFMYFCFWMYVYLLKKRETIRRPQNSNLELIIYYYYPAYDFREDWYTYRQSILFDWYSFPILLRNLWWHVWYCYRNIPRCRYADTSHAHFARDVNHSLRTNLLTHFSQCIVTWIIYLKLDRLVCSEYMNSINH